jgi:hypothetical protein
MPVSKLLVEGTLDNQILNALLQGNPLVEWGGSKSQLKPKARDQRSRGIVACYLRDRDFDHEPPESFATPVEDGRSGDDIIGWHWCRHEIESYLLDPELVSRAKGWDLSSYAGVIVDAARQIRAYQVARWAVGVARRALPPNYDLKTKPVELEDHELRLPPDLSEAASTAWARSHIAAFLARVDACLGATAADAELSRRASLLTEGKLGSAGEALLWCSGKDLLSSIEPWLKATGELGARSFLNSVRDWVLAHPEQALDVVPEWKGLALLLRS